MGKLIHGLHGPFTGKVGNIVGSSWNGIQIIKSRPRKRQSPPSEKERMVQHVFAMTQYWLKPLSDYLRVGFKGYSPRSRGITAAKSKLYERGLVWDGYDSYVDPSQVLISFGRLPLGDGFQMNFDQDTFEIRIHWDPSLPPAEGPYLAEADDQLMAVAYNIEAAETYGVLYGNCRREGAQSIQVPSGMQACYQVYAAFVSADRKQQSLSTYLGEIHV